MYNGCALSAGKSESAASQNWILRLTLRMLTKPGEKDKHFAYIKANAECYFVYNSFR
jgi:hypothetical protein